MFNPNKELGQNFLSSDQIVQDLIDALDFHEGEDIIEIGAGHGIISVKLGLLVRGTQSKADLIEIDDRFCQKLESIFIDDVNVKVRCENCLDFLPQYTTEKDYKIIGSLPYYITSPILHETIKMKKLAKVCVYVIQKEVAEKVSSLPPDASYLSSYVQTFFKVEHLFNIPRQDFNPVPEVDGGVIRLTRKDNNFGSVFKEKYEGFLHKVYAHPRKMLNKVLSSAELSQLGLNPSLRAQNVSAEEWLNYFHILNPNISYES